MTTRTTAAYGWRTHSKPPERIGGLQRTMLQTNAAIIAALIGLIATQL